MGTMPSTVLEFSLDRLGSYLELSVPGFGGLIGAVRLKGGNSNPTYRLDAQSGVYVLRRRPRGTLLPSAHSIDREFRVLSALERTSVPVPKPLHFATDESIIGAQFYVMACVHGRTYESPRLPELSTSQRFLVYREMTEVLAALHKLDYSQIGLEGFGKPRDYFRRQLNRWVGQYRASQTSRIDAMEALIAWLSARLPDEESRYCLVHGDFRLDNMLFDGTSHRLLALLDWELATLGPPYVDLAYQCMQWRLPAERPELCGLGGLDREALGIPDERAYVSAFCRLLGIPGIEHWNFYLAFSFFRLAAICQGIYRRALDGVLPSDKAQAFADAPHCIAETARAVLR